MIFKVLVWGATFAVIFGGALRVSPEALNRLIHDRPGLLVRTLVAIWIAVPVLTIVVVLALNVTGIGATTLLLMSVCPGVPMLLGSTRSVKGAVSTALVALLLTAVTEPLFIPAWTRLLTLVQPSNLTVRSMDVLSVRLPTLFLPVIVGFVVRARYPRASDVLGRLCDGIYVLTLIVGVVFVLIQGAPLLPRIPPETFAAAAIITVSDALIGYWAGRPNREDQKAIALAASLGNPALALAIVEVSYPGYQAGALVAVYLIVRAMALAPFEWWLKRLR